MKSSPQRNRPRRASGFSLVEVTLALGIVAFCLISLVGMFGVGLGNSRQSSDDTAQTSAAAQLVSQVRNTSTFDRGTSAPYVQGTHYFDARGQEVASNAATAVYVCQLNGAYVASSELPGIAPDAANPAQTTLTRLTLAFSLPASVPANQRVSSNVFYATVPSRTSTP